MFDTYSTNNASATIDFHGLDIDVNFEAKVKVEVETETFEEPALFAYEEAEVTEWSFDAGGAYSNEADKAITKEIITYIEENYDTLCDDGNKDECDYN